MRPVSLLLVALAGLALTGCPDRYRRPDDLQTDPAPYVQAVRDRNAAVHALAGELALEVWRGSERVRLKQLFAVQVPDRLRLSALTPFGQELSVLVSDGETLSIWAQDEKRFYQGAASAENLGRLVPVPLEPEALAALLRGSVPLLAGAEQQAVTWNGAEGWAVLRLTRGDVEEQIGFEPEHRRIVSLRLERAGKLLLKARLGRYDGEDPRTAMPHRLRLEAPGADATVDVEVVDVTVNPDLPAEAFTLEPPRGIAVEPL